MDETDQTPQDDFSKGVEHLHTTAKWLLIAFAAIGGILVAGTQLSNLGELPWGDPRLNLAIGAAAVALTFVAVDVLAVVAVLVSGYTTFTGLAKKERDGGNHETNFAKKEEMLDPTGFDSIAELSTTYKEVTSKRETLLNGYFDAVGDPTKAAEAEALAKKLKSVDTRLRYMDAVIARLISAIRYHSVRRRFMVSVAVVFISSAIAATAIGVFAWAANPPSAQEETTSQSVQTQ